MIAADDGMPLFTGAALVSETATKNHCHDLASVRKLEISRVPCRIRDERIFGAKIEKSLDHFQLCCICVRYQNVRPGVRLSKAGFAEKLELVVGRSDQAVAFVRFNDEVLDLPLRGASHALSSTTHFASSSAISLSASNS
jgi:hypothetical protein